MGIFFWCFYIPKCISRPDFITIPFSSGFGSFFSFKVYTSEEKVLANPTNLHLMGHLFRPLNPLDLYT